MDIKFWLSFPNHKELTIQLVKVPELVHGIRRIGSILSTCLFHLLYGFKWYGIIIIVHSSSGELRIWWDLSYSHRKKQGLHPPAIVP